MINIQEKIEHIVILMLENRSFDNLVGWLYNDDYRVSHFLPSDSPNHYAGLAGANYTNPTCFASSESKNIAIKQGAQNYCTPAPDPNEYFVHMNRQLFGDNIDTSNPNWLPPTGAIAEMNGFLVDYAGQDPVNPQQIMETYTPEQLPVISSLARNFAISDNYHASCPTQTWPNRAFMYAGTSLGRVNNAPYTPFNVTTLFNVLSQQEVSWRIYRGAKVIPSLTRLMMFDLWPRHFNKHFSDIDHFLEDCHNGTLPALSFLEPTFLLDEKNKLSLEGMTSF
ncbi:MAG: hypothetical protein GY821_16830 [Gammaproteobacteria bacterium]|nr:hypothetical protein [Gammaproteobacteria bacterium]